MQKFKILLQIKSPCENIITKIDFKILNKTKKSTYKTYETTQCVVKHKIFYEITNIEQSRIQGGSRGSNLFRTMRDYQICLKKKAQNKQTTIL